MKSSRLFFLAAVAVSWAGFAMLSAAAQAGEMSDKFAARQHRQVMNVKTMSGRARALGGSYAAISNGAAGTYENPAGLGAQTKHESHFTFGFESLEEGGNDGNIIIINAGGAVNINATNPDYWPRSEVGNRTVGLMVHKKEIDIKGMDGLNSDMNGFSLAYGQSMRGGWAFWGAAVSIFQGSYDDDNRNIFQQDLRVWEVKVGGILRATEQLSFGGTISLGRNRYDDAGTTLPTKAKGYQIEIRGGASFEVDEQTLLVGDIVYDSLENKLVVGAGSDEHNTWRLSAGFERVLKPETVTVRGGVYYFTDAFTAQRSRLRNVDDEWVGFTGGASYYKGVFELGYTFDIRTTGEVSHFLTLGMEW